MTSTSESQKSKQKSQTIPKEDIKTEIAGGLLSISDLLYLEEEDLRLQFKHLNL